MNIATLLPLILSMLAQIDKAELAKILVEVAKFIDPIVATKGPIIRFAWSILKNLLTSPDVAGELIAAGKVAAAAHPGAVQLMTPPHS